VKAKPGDTVLCTGLDSGVTDPVFQTGENLPPLDEAARPVHDLDRRDNSGGFGHPVCGNCAAVDFGLFQFNVKIPASAANGDLPVVITIAVSRRKRGRRFRY